MLIPDVNVLVGAHREENLDHAAHLAWLTEAGESAQPLGIPDVVLSGFIRIVTHPAVFSQPSSVGVALEAVRELRALPNFVSANPGPRHWPVFVQLCESTHARGNLVPDAFIAAIALENGAELITADGDFARFPGLRWSHPAAPRSN